MDGGGSRPSRSQPSGVRVVAKFVDDRHVADAHCPDGEPSRISISFSGDGHACVSICRRAKYRRSIQKTVYQLDYCYEEEKGVEEIYAVEVKPLVQRLFDGTNCCVISYGTHQSWPTQLFQGSGENPSLAEIAISEILNKNGEDIEMSNYEVFQDRIYDLLEPKDEGVQLKGLSKVKVNTLDEFKSYYYQSDTHIRGHRGLIVHVSNTSKLNFLELGGYGGGTENKSLYAVMNIVYAFNSHNHISYRESRLTHQLHDFFSPESRSVVIACLSRSDNLENMRALRLASCSSQVANQIQVNTFRRPTKQIAAPLKRYNQQVTQTKPVYGRINKCASAKHAIKKSGLVKAKGHSVASNSTAKPNVVQGELAESEASKSLISDMQQEVDQEESAESGITTDVMIAMQQEVALEESPHCEISNTAMLDLQQESMQGEPRATISAPVDISGASEREECKVVLEETTSHCIALDSVGEEGRTPAPIREPSPKISDVLREISNSLSLRPNNGKPIHICTPKKVNFSSCAIEPKTPNLALQFAIEPQESLKARTTVMKQSLQRECLTYMNSANKDELKRLKGIGEVRASRILQLRENNPEPFKDVEDLKNIGIHSKQFKKLLANFFEDC